MNIIEKEQNGIFYKYFYPSESISQVIIAVHGFAGDKNSSVIEALAKSLNKSTLVVSFDLHSHGEDKNLIVDLNKCLNYLDKVINSVKKEFSNVPISIFTTSFGAYLSLNYLENNTTSCKNIILRSPAIFMDKVLENILAKNGYYVQDLTKSNVNLGFERPIFVNLKFLTDLRKNSLRKYKFTNYIDIIQGDKDDIVDICKNEQYYKQNFLDYSLYYIKGADHRFKNAGELDKIIEIVNKILKN